MQKPGRPGFMTERKETGSYLMKKRMTEACVIRAALKYVIVWWNGSNVYITVIAIWSFNFRHYIDAELSRCK